MNKFLLVALLAVFATFTNANVCDDGWDPSADEYECMYEACVPEGGNCFYSNGANPFDGCQTYHALCQDKCYNACYDCVLCLYNNECCAHGDLVSQVPLCVANCMINSPSGTC